MNPSVVCMRHHEDCWKKQKVDAEIEPEAMGPDNNAKTGDPNQSSVSSVLQTQAEEVVAFLPPSPIRHVTCSLSCFPAEREHAKSSHSLAVSFIARRGSTSVLVLYSAFSLVWALSIAASRIGAPFFMRKWRRKAGGYLVMAQAGKWRDIFAPQLIRNDFYSLSGAANNSCRTGV